MSQWIIPKEFGNKQRWANKRKNGLHPSCLSLFCISPDLWYGGCMQKITMSNGVQIPQIGFGTWQIPSGIVTRDSVRLALEAGYRHIDTAAAYFNEQSVGEGIAESGIARGEIFLTTKLHNEDHGYDLTRAGFEKSLKALGVDYIDLYLIHWPNPIAHRHHWQEANAGSWRAIEEFYRAGVVKRDRKSVV